MEEAYNPRPTDAGMLLAVVQSIQEHSFMPPSSLLCIDTNDVDSKLGGDLQLHRLYSVYGCYYLYPNELFYELNEVPNKSYNLKRFIPVYLSFN